MLFFGSPMALARVPFSSCGPWIGAELREAISSSSPRGSPRGAKTTHSSHLKQCALPCTPHLLRRLKVSFTVLGGPVPHP